MSHKMFLFVSVTIYTNIFPYILSFILRIVNNNFTLNKNYKSISFCVQNFCKIKKFILFFVA